ncbi:hypothetical protein UNDKW_0734 [Undibacterium sp. KW1]|uniref:hypothetical protein n=1 Tax=Undibacterium sp. KW1 TaxID=2058624 RepID=UPI001331F14E|nr:hypothetical protein [Undibacterium sp. KW1]BBB59007.1 hypothetical protein UNDKW_0734 [Undibacterium sp. KW1]
MPNDHHDDSARQIPFQAYLLAPMFAPLTWLLAAVTTCLYGQGLSLGAFSMQFLFMLFLLLGSYTLCTPSLHIWAVLVRKPQKSKYAGFIVAAITALILGMLYAQPWFQDARHSTQNLVYLVFMLLTSLGMFMSLKNLFSPANQNNYPVSLAWMSKQPSVWGLFSLFKAALALLIICSTNYVISLPPLNFNFSSLFNFLYKQGSFTEEAFAASVFDINPGHFLDWCTYSAVILAVAAMASALQAKIRGEDSLYRAAGCVCGALALAVFDTRLAVYASLVYGFASYFLELRTRK